MDFVSDTFGASRKFRVLAVKDGCCREYLCRRSADCCAIACRVIDGLLNEEASGITALLTPVAVINKTTIGKMTQRAGRSRNIPSKQQRATGSERVFKMQTQPCALDPSAEKRSGLRVMDCRKQRKDRRAAKPMQIGLVCPYVGGFYARGAAFMRANKAEKHGFLPAPQGSGRKSVITPSMLDQK